MANLLATMVSSAGALSAYDRVLEVAQNNVANASTPGYARQHQSLVAKPFEPAMGLSGGVQAGELVSSRDRYAEQAVRRQNVLLGAAQQRVSTLTAIENRFDISGNSGIPKALNSLFESFSAWGQSPTDAISRQSVIERATDLAAAFQQTSANLTNVAMDTEKQLQGTVDQVNELAQRLQVFNSRILAGARNDAGLDAQIHNTLEELSALVDLTTLTQPDGSVSVLMNGQTPLLIGDKQYRISAKPVMQEEPPPLYPDARPEMRIFASDGAEITAATTGGKLGALLDLRNRLLTSYLGDANQEGDLNRMAAQFADRVNQLLTDGIVTEGDPPVAGIPLFVYDTANATTIARTLKVNSAITADQLAAISPGPPKVANAVPLALSALADPQQDADTVDGASYIEFFGRMASRTGNELNRATDEAQIQLSAVAQAKDLRDQMSGVSLDEEAIILIQFQRAYQANSRFLSVLDQLTGDLINILHP